MFAYAVAAQIMGAQLPCAFLQGAARQAGPQHTGEQFGEEGHDLGPPDAGVIGRVLHQLARLERRTDRLPPVGA